jgi:GT2 family glycosyltransferase
MNTATTGQAPRLSVLIVNFNSSTLLLKCLDSLLASTIADQLETIVVDNASEDFDADVMSDAHPTVRWLPQHTNLTYTGGNNLAFEHSHADLVLMLNPDTRVEPRTLERAVAHMDSTPDLVALGAYLIGPDGRLQRYYRRLPTVADLPVIVLEPLFAKSRRGRRYLMLDEVFDGETNVPQPPGAFLMLRRSTIDGPLLDPGYFNFLSDAELCVRLNRIGRVSVFEDVRCHHLRAGAGVGTRDLKQRLRLYHDFTWGIRRYFSQTNTAPRRTLLNTALVAYWAARVGFLVSRHPRITLRAMATAASALSGQPPQY